MDVLDKGMIHVLGGLEWAGAIFHRAPQKGEKFKAYELFISSYYHLIFLDLS